MINKLKIYLKMIDEYLDRLGSGVNRSRNQIKFLFDLLDGNLFKLIELEEKIKNNHIAYCPSTIEECEKILAMKTGNKKIFFKFN